MQFDTILTGGTVVTAEWVSAADIGIQNGKIEAILAPDTPVQAAETIDASGKYILPGGVDIHVHFEMDAGSIRSTDDFFTGTRAAAFGGTTTVMDFVEPEQEESLIDALEARKSAAREKAVIDYGLHMTIGPGQMDKVDEIGGLPAEGVNSCKLYMAYDFRLRDHELLQTLETLGNAGGRAVVHAENWDIITSLTARFIAEGRTEPKWHPVSRPAIFEAESINRIITMAEYTGTPVHIFHISCAEGVAAVTAAKRRGVPVTAETCPQYLFLTEDLYKAEGLDGALPICAPPIRNEEQRKALQGLLWEGEIDAVSSDHCPFTWGEKAAGADRFDTIPGGVPSVELRYPLLAPDEAIESAALHRRLSKWVRVCSTNPARIAGLPGKGDIRPGYDADLVIFNPRGTAAVEKEALHEAADWTPYGGLPLHGRMERVLSRGETIVKQGEFKAAPGRGRFISSG